MTLDQILANRSALVALICIVGFVVAVNLPLLFPIGMGKFFEREARTWGKAIQAGADVRRRNEQQQDELHRQVEQLKPPSDSPEEK
jgi:hypothetical protein